MQFVIRLLSLLLLCGLIIGCGEPAPPEFSEVSGTVTYRGKPVRFGMVVLKMKEGDQRGVGPISANGSYKLKCPTGPAVAAVVTRPATTESLKDPNRPAVRDVVIPHGVDVRTLPPEKYGSFNSSELEYTINPGSQTINIELK